MSRTAASSGGTKRPTLAIERRLGALNAQRRILRLISGLSTLAWVAAAAAVVLGVVGALLHPRAGIRCVLLGVFGALVLYVLIRHFLVRFLARLTVRSAAVLVEERFGGMRNNLVSAVDVWRTSLWKTSPAFATALAQVTQQQCDPLSFGKAARKGPAMKALVLGIVGVAVVAALVYQWPEEARLEFYSYLEAPRKILLVDRTINPVLVGPERPVLRGEPSMVKVTLEMRGSGFTTFEDFYVREEGTTKWEPRILSAVDDRGTQFEYRVQKTQATYYCRVRIGEKVSNVVKVHVVDRPRKVEMWLVYKFPQYMELPPIRVKSRDGDVRAIYGTFVDVRIESNVDLARGTIIYNNEEKRMKIKGKYAIGQMRIVNTGKYELRMWSEEGDYENLPLVFDAAVFQDSLPSVRVLNFKSEEVQVTMEQFFAVFVDLQARDREGIRQVDIEYQLAQLPGMAFRKLEKKGMTGTIFYDPPRQSVTETVDSFLADLPFDIEIGDVVTFRVKATDTCTVDNGVAPPEPHVVRSKTFRIVIVAEELAGLGLTPGYEWREDIIEQLEQQKSVDWFKEMVKKRMRQSVLKEDEKVGGREEPLEVKSHKPNIVSTQIGPSGGDARDFLSGEQPKDKERRKEGD
ncbi:MAG: hypothetical protein QGD94_00205 [Planctomycetia bacterium]|nr:hypothetical protein [Planctomycetia bacterium]